MLRRLGLICALLAMFTVAGGHWAVLQTVAWAEMLRDYSQRGASLTAAVEQTFDGQHPCALCREIQSGKAREHRENPAVPEAQKVAKVSACLADSGLPRAVRTAEEISFPRAAAPFAPRRAEAPPTPPPRAGVLTA